VFVETRFILSLMTMAPFMKCPHASLGWAPRNWGALLLTLL